MYFILQITRGEKKTVFIYGTLESCTVRDEEDVEKTLRIAVPAGHTHMHML